MRTPQEASAMTEEFTTADLIDELQEYVDEERKPGGVTPNEWAIAQGTSLQNARNYLDSLVLKGMMVKRKARVDGRRRFVYYKATPAALASQ